MHYNNLIPHRAFIGKVLLSIIIIHQHTENALYLLQQNKQMPNYPRVHVNQKLHYCTHCTLHSDLTAAAHTLLTATQRHST